MISARIVKETGGKQQERPSSVDSSLNETVVNKEVEARVLDQLDNELSDQ